MKKIIELNDDLVERLEGLKEKFNVKSLAPIVDIVLTIGLAQFEQFASGTVISLQPTYITYPLITDPYPNIIPWEIQDTFGNGKKVVWKHGNWSISCNQSTGASNVSYKK